MAPHYLLSLQHVALRKESVDRNPMGVYAGCVAGPSLSARRAWIEIFDLCAERVNCGVALRKESVDRNYAMQIIIVVMHGRSPQGERG